MMFRFCLEFELRKLVIVKTFINWTLYPDCILFCQGISFASSLIKRKQANRC